MPRALLALIAIGRADIVRARQKIGIIGRVGIGGAAFGQRFQAHIDIAVLAFDIIGLAAPGILHGDLLDADIGFARIGRPRPAIAADFAGIHEIVERDEIARQRMLVRRHRLAEHGQRRIGIAAPQIAQHLIVGAVFLDDIDDVLDALAKRRHQFRIGRIGDELESVVGGDRVGELPEIMGGRHRQAQETGMTELQNVMRPRIAGESVHRIIFVVRAACRGSARHCCGH